jgi:alpha-amylase
VDIKIAESDLYVAFIDDKLIVKLGPKYEVPSEMLAGFELATHGDDYAVWIRNDLLEQPFGE